MGIDHGNASNNEDEGLPSDKFLDQAIYEELRRKAAHSLRNDRAGRKVLQPTALVHEVYLRLRKHKHCRGRTHFLALASINMRRILVEVARNQGSLKRGKGRERVTLSGLANGKEFGEIEVLDFVDAVEELSSKHLRAAKVVEMRVSSDLTMKEISEVLGFSQTTINRDWEMARAWLNMRLGDMEVESDTE